MKMKSRSSLTLRNFVIQSFSTAASCIKDSDTKGDFFSFVTLLLSLVQQEASSLTETAGGLDEHEHKVKQLLNLNGL